MLFFIASIFYAQNSVWLDKEIDLKNLETSKDSFNIVQEGKIAGYWIWQTSKTKEEIVFKDISVLTGVFEDEFVLNLDSDKLFSKSVNSEIESDNYKLKVDVKRKSNLDLTGSFNISGS